MKEKKLDGIKKKIFEAFVAEGASDCLECKKQHGNDPIICAACRKVREIILKLEQVDNFVNHWKTKGVDLVEEDIVLGNIIGEPLKSTNTVEKPVKRRGAYTEESPELVAGRISAVVEEISRKIPDARLMIAPSVNNKIRMQVYCQEKDLAEINNIIRRHLRHIARNKIELKHIIE